MLKALQRNAKKKFLAKPLSYWLAWTVVTFGVLAGALWSILEISNALGSTFELPYRWRTQIAVFVAVAILPHFPLELMAMMAEKVTPQLHRRKTARWFDNLGAFVGVVERPLMLGSLVAGHPEFIGVWLLFKGIAGYRIGLDKDQILERRLFQLFLLNNAMSLGGVALGWLTWTFLRLPTSR